MLSCEHRLLTALASIQISLSWTTPPASPGFAARIPSVRGMGSVTLAISPCAALSARAIIGSSTATRARFSEFKGTPLFNTKLPHTKVLEILKFLGEGLGIRQIARLAMVHRDTVTRLANLAGRHAKAIHDELVVFSPRPRKSNSTRNGRLWRRSRRTATPTTLRTLIAETAGTMCGRSREPTHPSRCAWCPNDREHRGDRP